MGAVADLLDPLDDDRRFGFFAEEVAMFAPGSD